jgi:hypothetical protein
MSLSANKIILANASAKTPGAFVQVVSVANVGQGNATTMNVTNSGAQFIPTGIYMFPGQANVTIEINNYNNSTNTNAWTTYLSNANSGVIISDGYSLRANGASGLAATTVTLYGLNEGVATSNGSGTAW